MNYTAPMLADLHCHTIASDGSLTPDDLITRATANGVKLLSITDHDTLAAYEGLENPKCLELVPGIELSCQWRNRGVHIVGLNVDRRSRAMAEAVQSQQSTRQSRALMIAEKLEKLGVESPLSGAQAIAGNAVIGRPHFARHLANTGFVKNEQQAFKKLLGAGKVCDIKVCWPSLETAISWIRDAGGTPVLAHPAKYGFTRSWLKKLLVDFSAAGGLGMEIISGQQTPDQTRQYAELCELYHLAMSVGSDFHSPEQHWLDLGRYASLPRNFHPVWALWQ